jgi:hypothetical protein
MTYSYTQISRLPQLPPSISLPLPRWLEGEGHSRCHAVRSGLRKRDRRFLPTRRLSGGPMLPKHPRFRLDPGTYKELWLRVLVRDNWTCQVCGSKTWIRSTEPHSESWRRSRYTPEDYWPIAVSIHVLVSVIRDVNQIRLRQMVIVVFHRDRIHQPRIRQHPHHCGVPLDMLTREPFFLVGFLISCIENKALLGFVSQKSP